MNCNTSQAQSLVLPETINIHLTRSCNFRCRFCYAEFAECASASLPPDQLWRIIEAIARAKSPVDNRRRKLNFAGGEPMLYPHLLDAIEYCKQLGLRTSLVTNGSLLEDRAIARLSASLDICALSIDSALTETNNAIGRFGRSVKPDANFYQSVAQQIHRAKIRFKVNTVVNRLNLTENLGALVGTLMPFRWKLFQIKPVTGQNDQHFEELSIGTAEFEEYVVRNRLLVPPGVVVVPETVDDMTGSYAMIAPNGCFFDSASGCHRYSRRILEAGIIEAFQEVAFDTNKFIKRGGVYE